MKDENGNLLTASCNILNRWKTYLYQLLNVHSVSDVKQKEDHTAEQLVPDPCYPEVVTATIKLKKHKSPGRDHIPAELIQAGGKTLLSAIHKLINSIWN
jgi:hypothetical protein